MCIVRGLLGSVRTRPDPGSFCGRSHLTRLGVRYAMRNVDSLFDISGRTIHSVWLFCIVIGTISCGEPAVPEGPALEEIFAIEVPLDRVRALDRYLAGATLADLHEIEAAADAARPRIDHATGAVLAAAPPRFSASRPGAAQNGTAPSNSSSSSCSAPAG